jgi:putative phosphoribosyl transferase
MEGSMTDTTTRSYPSCPISIPAAGVNLTGDLMLPAGAGGLVVFAHGSGSSRLSPRNRLVAQRLQDAGLGTLLFDLLTEREAALDSVTGTLRFDIALLATRLSQATEWIASQPATGTLRLGYFGASTGAAAALVSAAQHPQLIAAVVSRGGRPDLAGSHLREVRAPTLLIVGGADLQVLRINHAALAQLAAREKELSVVPGATHLFEEPGALERVSDLARAWFSRHLRP